MIGQVGNKSITKNWVRITLTSLFVLGLIAMFVFGKV